jgi:hypothetical protein
MAKGLAQARVRELARDAAAKLLQELKAEVSAIERTFPELAGKQRSKTLGKIRKSGRKMSAAARKAVSARMKKYWAERRKAKSRVK